MKEEFTMYPTEQFILMAIVSLVVATMVGLAWMKFSLFIGNVLKRRYTKIKDKTQLSGAVSNLNNSSYHSGNQRQQCDQQINSAHAIKSIYQSYHHWIVSLIDGVIEPLYRHINRSPQKQHKDTKTGNKYNSRNLK